MTFKSCLRFLTQEEYAIKFAYGVQGLNSKCKTRMSIQVGQQSSKPLKLTNAHLTSGDQVPENQSASGYSEA